MCWTISWLGPAHNIIKLNCLFKLCFLNGLNKQDVLITELLRCWKVDFVTFAQSQASHFPISSHYAKLTKQLLAVASY